MQWIKPEDPGFRKAFKHAVRFEAGDCFDRVEWSRSYMELRIEENHRGFRAMRPDGDDGPWDLFMRNGGDGVFVRMILPGPEEMLARREAEALEGACKRRPTHQRSTARL